MIKIFELPWGYGYQVEHVYQEYDPEYEGFVPMSRERAQSLAEEVLKRINPEG